MGRVEELKDKCLVISSREKISNKKNGALIAPFLFNKPTTLACRALLYFIGAEIDLIAEHARLIIDIGHAHGSEHNTGINRG
jgi:hypothetical protein